MHYLQRFPIHDKEQLIYLTESQYVIGRRNNDGNVTYIMHYFNVSKIHMKMVRFKSKWRLVDLKSFNGTFLNGVKMMPNIVYTLKHHDKIGIGCPIEYSRREINNQTFVFRYNVPLNEQGE